jgi:hypothetical protein
MEAMLEGVRGLAVKVVMQGINVDDNYQAPKSFRLRSRESPVYAERARKKDSTVYTARMHKAGDGQATRWGWKSEATE